MNLRIVDVDLEQLLDEALSAVVTGEASGRSIEWRRSRLPWVQGDPALLRQLLVNLLSNAIKYTRTRQPAIIEIGTRAGRVDEIIIFVRDNGVGFDVRQAAGLFVHDEQLPQSGPLQGLGIGLASAQQIVARHGGAIWADATVGRGATFFFSLPAIAAP